MKKNINNNNNILKKHFGNLNLIINNFNNGLKSIKGLIVHLIIKSLFYIKTKKNRFELIHLSKILSIRGGQFTKSRSNNTITEVQKENGNGNSDNNINDLNRAHIKPKEKVISSNKAGRSLKDVSDHLEPEFIDTPGLKPKVVDVPTFKPEIINKPDDFKSNRNSNILSNNKEKDKNIEEIIKEMRRIQEKNAEREIAIKERLKKQYDKLHIKKFARDNLKPIDRVRFIHLPLSNKEIFDAFVFKNKNSIKYLSYFLNIIFISFYIQFFKFFTIKNYNLFCTHSRDKNFKKCIKPIVKILTILLLFILILLFSPRVIKFIILKLLYNIFICYKFVLYRILLQDKKQYMHLHKNVL